MQIKLIDALEIISTSASDLITPSKGTITTHGLLNNVSVSLRYLEAWLRGQGVCAFR